MDFNLLNLSQSSQVVQFVISVSALCAFVQNTWKDRGLAGKLKAAEEEVKRKYDLLKAEMDLQDRLWVHPTDTGVYLDYVRDRFRWVQEEYASDLRRIVGKPSRIEIVGVNRIRRIFALYKPTSDRIVEAYILRSLYWVQIVLLPAFLYTQWVEVVGKANSIDRALAAHLHISMAHMKVSSVFWGTGWYFFNLWYFRRQISYESDNVAKAALRQSIKPMWFAK